MLPFNEDTRKLTLIQYVGKSVVIYDVDGAAFIGVVEDYFYADENEDGKESIIVKVDDFDLIEFTQEDIDKICLI